MPTLTSRNSKIQYGAGFPTLLINDQLTIMDQTPRMLQELKEGKVDLMVEIARWGLVVGMDTVAILIDHPEVDDVEMLPRIAHAIHKEVGCPIGLDSRNPAALAAALEEMQPYKCVVFTVNGEQAVLESMLPVIQRYKAVIAVMPMGHFSNAVPMTVKGRMAEVRYILEVIRGYGIPKEDVVIDAICMAASTLLAESYQVTLGTLKAVREELGLATQLGVANSGSGMPDPTRIDLAYLLGAMPWGLDAAFINPATVSLMESVTAMDFLTERDPVGRRYLQYWRDLYGPHARWAK
jgi:5-methyltetrahydrofolate--homocysteine methyltransferase